MDAGVWAGVSAMASVLTAAIAAGSLTGSRRDSRDRSRPIVVARLRKGPSTSHGVTYLVVSNLGASVARQVQVTFDPELPEYEKAPDGKAGVVAPFLRRRYESPITVLAPTQSLANIYYYSGMTGRNLEDVPDEFTVRVSYLDDRRRKYEDAFPLRVQDVNLETQSNPGKSNDPVERRNVALESISWGLWDR